MHFLGLRFAPPQAIFRARLRRLRASALAAIVEKGPAELNYYSTVEQ